MLSSVKLNSEISNRLPWRRMLSIIFGSLPHVLLISFSLSNLTAKVLKYSVKMRLGNAIVLGLCVIGFSFLCFDQLKKFTTQNKLNLFSYERLTEESLFVMVFCPQAMFNNRKGRPARLLNDSEVYDKFVNQANVDFQYLSHKNILLKNFDPPKEFKLRTKYCGLCKAFDFGKRKHKLNTVATFSINKAPGPMSLFIFRSWNEIISLGDFRFYQHPPVLKIETSSMVLMNARYHETLHLPYDPCQEDQNYDFQDFFECVADELNRFATESGLECAPLHLWPFLKSLDGKPCKDHEVERNVSEHASEIVASQINGDRSVCIRPCKIPVLEAKSFPIGDPKDNETLSRIHVVFDTGVVEWSKEKYLYSPYDIISSIGGALGMTLGWSMFHTINWIRDYLADYCKLKPTLVKP